MTQTSANLAKDPAIRQTAVFRIAALYGLSRESVQVPIGEDTHIESGQVCLTLDPDTTLVGNVGQIDFVNLSLTVKYDAQLVFPGLYNLVRTGNYDPTLLNPVRVTATDECKVFPDLSGWHAIGCLEFLPGSLWSAAKGG